MAKGLVVEIFRPANFPDCTNNGISGKVHKAILTGYGMTELFEPSSDCPELKIVCRILQGKKYYHCEPISGLIPHNVGWFMGGNFVYSCDGRYRNVIEYPMPIHDRQETQEQYNSLSD